MQRCHWIEVATLGALGAALGFRLLFFGLVLSNVLHCTNKLREITHQEGRIDV